MLLSAAAGWCGTATACLIGFADTGRLKLSQEDAKALMVLGLAEPSLPEKARRRALGLGQAQARLRQAGGYEHLRITQGHVESAHVNKLHK